MAALLIIPLVVGIFFLIIWLFKWLWNITMPQVFNLKTITYWQAFRLILIAGILFGGLRYKGRPGELKGQRERPAKTIQQMQER